VVFLLLDSPAGMTCPAGYRIVPENLLSG